MGAIIEMGKVGGSPSIGKRKTGSLFQLVNSIFTLISQFCFTPASVRALKHGITLFRKIISRRLGL